MFFIIETPPKVTDIPITTLKNIYKIARPNCPSRISCMFSIEKAEKVVKPPQKPVVNINFHSLEYMFSFSNHPYNKPIIKQPRIFTSKVA